MPKVETQIVHETPIVTQNLFRRNYLLVQLGKLMRSSKRNIGNMKILMDVKELWLAFKQLQLHLNHVFK